MKKDLKDEKKTIERLYNKPPAKFSAAEKKCILSVIQSLDCGEVQVCEKLDVKSDGASAGPWQVNQWVKQAILLYFRIQNVTPMKAGVLNFLDKIPPKKLTKKDGVRVVPPAVARFGSFIEAGAILMPSYINIGAYVGAGTMVDTWATVGSCARIGKNVHLSGGVGIGGVLEPVQAQPVIIEDNVFIGSRCIVVEGVHIEEGAVLGAGVTLTASTKIFDITAPNKKEYKSFIPKNAVVIPGSIEKEFPSGSFYVPCALIIGQRTESTDKKTSLTQALREFDVSV